MSKPTKETFTRARYEVLNHVLSFPTIRSKDWEECRVPIEGDLVTMSCAPASEWYLSWVEDVELHDNGFHRYCLRSFETQQLCWWSNVGILVFDRERVKDREDWSWSDRQYKFRDRLNRVCYKDHDAFIIRPNWPEFGDDFSVKLSFRSRFSDSFKFEKSFPDWRKVTKKIMSDTYLAAVKYNDERER